METSNTQYSALRKKLQLRTLTCTIKQEAYIQHECGYRSW